MDVYVALISFPIIFLGELPDKTMFASLVLATRGRPRQVWVGAAAAFALHVAVAVTVGVALFALLPHQVVDAVVAGLFLVGAGYAWWMATHDGAEPEVPRERSGHGAVLTAFVVIFLAEWGDLTQILTANLAAKYRAPFAVGVGSTLALWAVAGLAVAGGQALLRVVKISTVRRVTAVALLILAGYTAWTAVR